VALKRECREILRRICMEAGRREDSPYCREVARHLAACEACREEAITLRGTLELYWCMERKEVPAEAVQALRKRLGLPTEGGRPAV
jgi:hypothetical protein